MLDLSFNKRFKESSSINKKRKKLLKIIIDYSETGILEKGFSKEFYKYINDLSFNMIEGGEDYYALFLRETKIEINFSIEFPTASVLKEKEIIIYINPISYLFLEIDEAIALLKHEIYHIILKHHSREKILKAKYSSLSINLALDISVNQYIQNLPTFSEKISTVNRRFNLSLTINETFETYVHKIDKAIKLYPKKAREVTKEGDFDYSQVHSIWSESKDTKDEEIKEQINLIMKNSMKNGVPSEVEKILKEYQKPKIPWSIYLKRYMKKYPRDWKKTTTRLNRRQPKRLDLRGKLRDHNINLVLVLDISASISKAEFDIFLKEVFSINQFFKYKINIIEADDNVRRDYYISSLKDIRPMVDRRGGTNFSNTFEYLNNKKLKDSLVVYFTDGMGEKVLDHTPQNYDLLWVVNGKEISLKKLYGNIIFIKEDMNYKNDLEEELYNIREMVSEWAR